MAPARSSTRRGAHTGSASHHEAGQDLQNDGHNATKLFLDPNFGTPLQIYIEKDVEDKDVLCQLIQVVFFSRVHPSLKLIILIFLSQKHGGTVSPVYSRGNVAYILGTNSISQQSTHSNIVFQWIHISISGQNLFKQYAGKEGKAVLDARWVNECIKANALLTWQTSWGGCKVTGSEA
jgi:hypothetical protein